MKPISRLHSHLKLTILYEDDDFVAVNKPAGLIIHPDGRPVEAIGVGPFLTDWVLEHYPKTKDVGEPIVTTTNGTIIRPGIVHRLDKGTSGVIIVAKTAEAHAHLKAQFQARTVAKKYYAFVYGKLSDQYGIINRPMGRSKKDFRRWSAQRGARGELRPAETWYTTLAVRDGLDRGDGSRGGNGFSFIEVEPKTGRTHQIRVHFKAINHPIICDDLYAPERECALDFGRPALHAHRIEFTAMNGRTIAIEAPLPDDFIHAFKLLDIVPPIAAATTPSSMKKRSKSPAKTVKKPAKAKKPKKVAKSKAL